MPDSISGNRKRPNEAAASSPDRNKRRAQSDVSTSKTATDDNADISSHPSKMVQWSKTKCSAGEEKRSDDMSDEDRLVHHCDLDLSRVPLTCLTEPSLLMVKEIYIYARTLAVFNDRSSLFSINTTPQLGPRLSESVQQRIGRSAFVKGWGRPNNVCYIHVGRTSALGFDTNFYLICPEPTPNTRQPDNFDTQQSRRIQHTATGDMSHKKLETWYDKFLLPVLRSHAMETQYGWRWDDWRQALANSNNGPGGEKLRSPCGAFMQEQRIPAEVLGEIWEGVKERLADKERLAGEEEDDFLEGAFLFAYGQVPDFSPSGGWVRSKERWDRCITLEHLFDCSEIETRLRLSFEND